MPMNRDRYPPDWADIALALKQSANWTCQNCGRPCRLPGESDEDLIERIESNHPAWIKELRWWEADGDSAIEIRKLGRFTLTVAHPNHDLENPNAELRAWCTVCHCRHDLKAMPTKIRLKREWHGQLSLFPSILERMPCHSEKHH
jgi:hypothetical protein